MHDLNGRAAFITGGASGIGFALAEALAGHGVKIALADIEPPALAQAVETLRANGATATGIQLNVMDRNAVANAAAEAEAALGPVHLLCNNAGVTVRKPVDEATYADWDWVLGVNLGGVVNGIAAFLPRMKQHGEGGHILNTSSVGGLMGMGGLGLYCASKFAVVGLSESLRVDLAPAGIGVSVLCPGIVNTRFANTERNRPAELANASSPQAGGGETRRSGSSAPAMEASDVARMAVDGIRDNALYICTHPEFRDMLRRRSQMLDAAFPAEAAAEKSAAIASMIAFPYT